jgi:mono/diheme cytochrome c family protein
VKGDGEKFGPDLTRIGMKVNPDWLVSWISNPHHYNSKAKMPDLNIGVDQAQHLAAFLLQNANKQPDPSIEAALRDPKNIELGETLVRRRGCFACHDIHGMEKEGRIAPELSSFGVKQTRELEFGDNIHIPHNWESWTHTKLKNPSAFRTDRVLDKMPNFGLSEDEIQSLMVLLKGFNGANIAKKFRKQYTDDELTIERGRRLVTRYNCRGCHVVEGEGGAIQNYLKAKAQYPPPLIMGDYQVGERIKGSWIYSFLRNPTPVRKWIKVKMPKFAMSEQDARDLTAYFQLMVPDLSTYEPGINLKKDMKSVETGVSIVNYMDCGKCHDEGSKGIEFKIASERLREKWIPKWLKDTRELIPWTPMPNHWPKEGDKYTIQTKFRKLKTVDKGNVDTAIKHIEDFLVAYNNPNINFDLVLGEEPEEGGDEFGGEEDMGDGEDTMADAGGGDDEEEEEEE